MVVEFSKYVLFPKEIYAVISIIEGSAEELTSTLKRINKPFDDCKAIFLCSKVSEYYYHVSHLLQFPNKEEISVGVLIIILRYLLDRSCLIDSEVTLTIDDKKMQIMIIDKELMIFHLNGKVIKMIKHRNIAQGQMKIGTATIGKKE